MFGKNNNGGILNVIRCDEPDYLIWKWHPARSVSGQNNRENTIRWGSSLRVKEGSVAAFVYKQDEETYQEFIEGPFDEILKTKNLPIISKIVGLLYGGDSPFQAEVYFINLAKIIQLKFAVPFFDVFDPRFEDYSVPVAVRGSVTYRIADYREFIKLHRLETFSVDEFNKQVKDVLARYVKEIIINIPLNDNVPAIQIERYISRINRELGIEITERFSEELGVIVSSVDVSSVEVDRTSEGFRQLKAITQDIVSSKIKAKTEAELLDISGMQRINLHDYEENLRIQREEKQYAQHLRARTDNIGAYQVEKQTEVGIAGANALGQMGSNGVGGIEIGGNSSDSFGFNPAAMMTSMTIGGAIGQNIVGTLNGIMSSQQNTREVPPIPIVSYNIIIDNKSCGPYNIEDLKKLAQEGKIDANSYIWKPGMSEWTEIRGLKELESVLLSIPPKHPNRENLK